MLKQSALSLIVFFSLFCYGQSAFAQERVNNYVPPPLFGGAPKATPIVPNNKQEDNTTIELRQNENKATLKKVLPKRPQKSPTDTVKAVKYVLPNAPLPKRKPTTPPAAVKKAKADKAQTAQQTPLTPSPSTVKSQGVVKGPKTMPAVKKEDVDIEIVNKETENVKTNMLARVQEEAAKKKKEQASVLASKPTKKPNSLFKDRLVLVFEAKQAGLSDAKKTLLNEQVVPALLGNEKRLNITAYASPGNEVNTDKRIALSRGLAVRAYLIEKGLSPSQINVRSLGAQTNTQPYDRVELDLIQ